MAIRQTCSNCGKEFITSRVTWLCDDCSGRTKELEDEELRWKALSLEERIEELRQQIERISSRNRRLA